MMRKPWMLIAAGLILVPAAVYVQAGGSTPQSGRPVEAVAPASESRAILDRYCVTCHNEKLKTAGLSLDTLDLARVGEHAEVWEKVDRKLRAEMMPPVG